MNQQEKTDIAAHLQNLRTIKLEAVLAERYPEQDLNAITIGRFTAKQILSFHESMLSNFENSLEEDFLLLIPASYYLNNNVQNGQFSIVGDLTNYYQGLVNYDPNFSNLLDRLITYQILYGFWNKSTRKFHYAKSTEILGLKSELQIVKESASTEFKKYKKKKEELEQLQKSVDDFYQQKQRELQSIADNSSGAVTSLQQINELNAQARELKEKINGVLEQHEKSLKDSNEAIAAHEEKLKELISKHATNLEENGKEFSAKKKELAEYLKSLTTSDADFKKALQFAIDQKDFLEQKKKEMVELTGQAADASLGHTFRSRRDTLGENVTFWRWAIGIVSIGAIAWVVLVFYCFSTAYSPQWLGVIINVLKTSPAFILLGFCISQYNKERHLQEEYAFKAAVAMTITAYSDRLSDPKVKEEMLLESTQKVYRNPNTLIKKDVPLISFGSKELTNTLKEITESVKNIKN